MARDLLGRVLGYGNRQAGVDTISGNPVYSDQTIAPILMRVYRNPATSANGTVLRLDNLYDQSKTASFALYHTPIITSVGTQRGIDKYIISNSTNPAFASPRSGSSGKHYVFNANTNYLLQCTNNSASTATLYLEWLFYEQMS